MAMEWVGLAMEEALVTEVVLVLVSVSVKVWDLVAQGLGLDWATELDHQTCSPLLWALGNT
jgi:hypothetical protein